MEIIPFHLPISGSKKKDLFNTKYKMSDLEITDYLNSLSKYVKDVYREITYHLSITQLKNLPIPNKKEWEEIKRKEIL